MSNTILWIALALGIAVLIANINIRNAEVNCKEYAEMKQVETKWTQTGCWIKQPDGTFMNNKFQQLPN